jgi:hypothetical protein
LDLLQSPYRGIESALVAFAMYENRSQPLLSRVAFFWRLAGTVAVGVVIVAVSLFAGMVGYHALEGLGWLDAFLNAAMLLGGMGPVEQPQTPGGKLFAGLYALYCGLAVIAIVGVMFAPVVHRFLHKFHLQKSAS